MQYHEVKINIEFRPVSECFTATQDPTTGTPAFDAASLFVDYVYLDTDERRRFAQVSHEYLIEQLQFTGTETLTSTSNKIRLNFNHPVKEIVWVARRDVSETANEWTNFTDATGFAGGDPLVDAKLQLNGHDRFSVRVARYFNLVQPFQHHTNIPVTGIYVYSFGLKPEEHQPSGTANLSRIDNATFIMTFAAALFTGNATVSLLVYATNYNVLRIMSGELFYAWKSNRLLAMWIRQQRNSLAFHNQLYLIDFMQLLVGNIFVSGETSYNVRRPPKAFATTYGLETYHNNQGNDLGRGNNAKGYYNGQSAGKEPTYTFICVYIRFSLNDRTDVGSDELKIQSSPLKISRKGGCNRWAALTYQGRKVASCWLCGYANIKKNLYSTSYSSFCAIYSC